MSSLQELTKRPVKTSTYVCLQCKKRVFRYDAFSNKDWYYTLVCKHPEFAKDRHLYKKLSEHIGNYNKQQSDKALYQKVHFYDGHIKKDINNLGHYSDGYVACNRAYILGTSIDTLLIRLITRLRSVRVACIINGITYDEVCQFLIKNKQPILDVLKHYIAIEDIPGSDLAVLNYPSDLCYSYNIMYNEKMMNADSWVSACDIVFRNAPYYSANSHRYNIIAEDSTRIEYSLSSFIGDTWTNVDLSDNNNCFRREYVKYRPKNSDVSVLVKVSGEYSHMGRDHKLYLLLNQILPMEYICIQKEFHDASEDHTDIYI